MLAQIIKDLSTSHTQYTPMEYLQISIINAYGLDKLNFPSRLATFDKYKSVLWDYVSSAKNKPAYIKGLFALKDVLKGIPTNYIMGLDSASSGGQLLSTLTNCYNGCLNTGIIDPSVMSDLYISIKDHMNTLVDSNISIDRTLMKSLIMPFYYFSDSLPKKVFGKNTKELNAFYQSLETLTSGAFTIRNVLFSLRDPTTSKYEFTLPDGFNAKVMVKNKILYEITCEELNNEVIEIISTQNIPNKHCRALGAGVTHGIDGFMVRELSRRCNYNKSLLTLILNDIKRELLVRNIDETMTNYSIDQFLSTIHISTLTIKTLKYISDTQLLRCKDHLTKILQYPSFEIISIHDEFMCSPLHMGRLRYWYKEILAEMSESTLLNNILSELNGEPIVINKDDFNEGYDIPHLIRNSNYGIA